MRSLGPEIRRSYKKKSVRRGGGGVLPSKRLLGMCRWTGSHFHSWTDYIMGLLEWGRKFSGFLG